MLWISLLSVFHILLLLYALHFPPLLLLLQGLSNFNFSFRHFLKHFLSSIFSRFNKFVYLRGFSGAKAWIVLQLKVVIWISHSPQDKPKMCRFLEIALFEFLLGNFGCFLDQMGVENQHSWRYHRSHT